MDFVTEILAKLFDSFKASNPKLAGVIILILTMLIAGLETDYAAELLGSVYQRTLQIALLVWTALQGSRTTKVLNETKK
jgi:hypothetical protein